MFFLDFSLKNKFVPCHKISFQVIQEISWLITLWDGKQKERKMGVFTGLTCERLAKDRSPASEIQAVAGYSIHG